MVSRVRARLAVSVVAVMVAAFMVQPSTPVSATSFNDSANPGCPEASGLPSASPQVVAFTGTLTCYRPGAHSFGAALTRAPDIQQDNNPTLGEPCRNVYYHSVAFVETAQGQITAIFSGLEGNTTAVTRILTPDEATMASSHDALVADAQTGTYQPSNPGDPSSPLQCKVNATYPGYCPGAVNPIGPFCYIWQLDAGLGSGTPPSPAPYLAAAFGNLAGQSGTVGSAPSEKGLVNQPVCFWIDRMGIPVEEDLILTVAGPPDAAGRQIFYTYLARVTFAGVSWHFGDAPNDTSTTMAPPQCGQHPQLTAHIYSQISDSQPNGRYQVTASERYDVSVHVWWVGDDGPHDEGIDPGVTVPPVPTTPYLQYVGQLEGVPVG